MDFQDHKMFALEQTFIVSPKKKKHTQKNTKTSAVGKPLALKNF